MIQIENFTYRYNSKQALFRGLNLQLSAGHVYGLLGKNGAGKSTLIKNISGFLFPTHGKCIVNGLIPRNRDTAFLEKLFYIAEECQPPNLWIKEMIGVYAPFYPAFNESEFFDYLKTFHVNADSHLSRLSFGQKKKAFISFALAANTRVLIMDEPTNGLDIPSKLQFRNIVSSANRTDKVTIMSTHQVRDLDDLISSILIVDDGDLLLYADKDEINDKLFFETVNELPGNGRSIYHEHTPKGIASISVNTEKKSSYLDIEILFNGVLTQPEKFNSIFNACKLFN